MTYSQQVKISTFSRISFCQKFIEEWLPRALCKSFFSPSAQINKSNPQNFSNYLNIYLHIFRFVVFGPAFV